MKSKGQDAAQSNISPVLFMSVEGTPISFYLRPGPAKVTLQPLITAGGGTLCNVQQPGAILLMDPTEESSIIETTAHWYVSTKYIIDCIEHNKQLNMEDYKLDSSAARKYSTRVGNNNKPSYTALLGGRQHYTPEEDAAILNYVNKYKKGLGGNLIWKKMEKEGVTSHSWQSMKYRYNTRLAKKNVNVATADNVSKLKEAENQVDKNSETISQDSSTAADASGTHTDESESRQDNNPPAETVEDEQAAENNQENTDGSNSPGLCPAEDCHPHPAEKTDTDETQAVVPTPHQFPPNDSPQPKTMSPADVSTLEAPEVKHMPPSSTRSARRQLLNGSSSPNGGCGQSAISAELPTASPKPPRKTMSSTQSPLCSAAAEEEPPLKKARGDNVQAVTQGHQAADPRETHSGWLHTDTQDIRGRGTRDSLADQKLAQLRRNKTNYSSDSEAAPTPQEGGKKKEKVKLGILDLATREFESESDDDPPEERSLETRTETSTRAMPGCSTWDPRASSEVPCEHRAQSSRHKGGFQAATGTSVPATSKAHLFIFDRESQDVESQPDFTERPAAQERLQESSDSGAAHPLSQMQLEEDRQRIRKLMEETKRDLVTVTKALLKTSGDFAEAHNLLLDLLPSSGPLWQCSDDDLLIAGDPAVRLQLQEKYGEELVAKRVVFLQLEQ